MGDSRPLERLWESLAGLFGARAGLPGITVLDVLAGAAPEWLYVGEDIARYEHDSGEVITADGRPIGSGRTQVSFSTPRGDWGGLRTVENDPAARPGRWPDGDWLGDVAVLGHAEAVASFLDPFTRSEIPHMATHSLRIDRCVVRLTLRTRQPDWQEIRDRLVAAADLAVRIETARYKLHERLLERLEDPVPAVRLHTAELLFERQVPGDERLRELLLRSGDTEIVSKTASRIGHAQGLLEAIATDADAGGPVRAAAAVVLLGYLPASAAAIVQALGAVRYKPAYELTLASLRHKSLPVLEAAMARLWHDAGTRTGRGALLDHLSQVLAALPREVAVEGRVRDTLARLGRVAKGEQVVAVASELAERGHSQQVAAMVGDLLEELQADRPWSPRALQVLGRLERHQVSEKRLRRLLERKSPAVWRWTLELARHHEHPGVASAATGFETWMDHDDATSIVGRLGLLGGADARRVLRGLLGRRHDDELRLFAIEALGDCGVLRDVEALLEMERRERGARRRAARAAIERIQDRAGPTERGALTLATEQDEAGRLAVAGDGGELAVAEE